MLVSFRHRLVILSTPKCASTALQRAIGGEMDMVLRSPPGAKHTPLRQFDRLLRPFVEKHAGGPVETVCLFREPADWLASWWRYRARPGIPDKANSTAGMSFPDFVAAYLDGARGPAHLGRQSKFVATRDGRVGVDRIFPYEDLGRLRCWLEERLGRGIALERVNVSPEAPGPTALPGPLAVRLRTELHADFALHEAALAGGDLSGRPLPSP